MQGPGCGSLWAVVLAVVAASAQAQQCSGGFFSAFVEAEVAPLLDRINACDAHSGRVHILLGFGLRLELVELTSTRIGGDLTLQNLGSDIGMLSFPRLRTVAGAVTLEAGRNSRINGTMMPVLHEAERSFNVLAAGGEIGLVEVNTPGANVDSLAIGGALRVRAQGAMTGPVRIHNAHAIGHEDNINPAVILELDGPFGGLVVNGNTTTPSSGLSGALLVLHGQLDVSGSLTATRAMELGQLGLLEGNEQIVSRTGVALGRRGAATQMLELSGVPGEQFQIDGPVFVGGNSTVEISDVFAVFGFNASEGQVVLNNNTFGPGEAQMSGQCNSRGVLVGGQCQCYTDLQDPLESCETYRVLYPDVGTPLYREREFDLLPLFCVEGSPDDGFNGRYVPLTAGENPIQQPDDLLLYLRTEDARYPDNVQFGDVLALKRRRETSLGQFYHFWVFESRQPEGVIRHFVSPGRPFVSVVPPRKGWYEICNQTEAAPLELAFPEFRRIQSLDGKALLSGACPAGVPPNPRPPTRERCSQIPFFQRNNPSTPTTTAPTTPSTTLGPLDECLRAPCGNGGTCVPSFEAPGFICVCASGFEGLLCATASPTPASSSDSDRLTLIIVSVVFGTLLIAGCFVLYLIGRRRDRNAPEVKQREEFMPQQPNPMFEPHLGLEVQSRHSTVSRGYLDVEPEPDAAPAVGAVGRVYTAPEPRPTAGRAPQVYTAPEPRTSAVDEPAYETAVRYDAAAPHSYSVARQEGAPEAEPAPLDARYADLHANHAVYESSALSAEYSEPMSDSGAFYATLVQRSRKDNSSGGSSDAAPAASSDYAHLPPPIGAEAAGPASSGYAQLGAGGGASADYAHLGAAGGGDDEAGTSSDYAQLDTPSAAEAQGLDVSEVQERPRANSYALAKDIRSQVVRV